MFWCAASTADDDVEVKEAKWLSITGHIMNKHSGHENPLFRKCLHGRLHGRERRKKWLKPGRFNSWKKYCTVAFAFVHRIQMSVINNKHSEINTI